jgi:Molybdopterin guanine dinucleotide synthesis protein B
VASIGGRPPPSPWRDLQLPGYFRAFKASLPLHTGALHKFALRRQALSRIQDCDLVLVEGFKGGDFPKLEVWRAAVGKPMLWPEWPGIVAMVGDAPDRADAPPHFSAAVLAPLVELVLQQAREVGA